MENTNCKLCNSQTKFWRSKNKYSIYNCNNCGFAQVLPKLSNDEIFNLYNNSGHDSGLDKKIITTKEEVFESERIYPNSTIDAKNIVNEALKIHNSNKNILLDIGSGYGLFSNEFIKNKFEVIAIEMAKNERQIFESINGFEPINITFEDFESNKKFSHILLSQVLEHVNDPLYWIEKCNTLLDNDGLLIIALPNFGSIFRKILNERESFIIPPYHLNYFSKKSLTKLLIENNFEIKEFKTISRLPFHKIFIKAPLFLRNPLSIIGNIILYLIDLLNLGSIIQIYARKK